MKKKKIMKKLKVIRQELHDLGNKRLDECPPVPEGVEHGVNCCCHFCVAFNETCELVGGMKAKKK